MKHIMELVRKEKRQSAKGDYIKYTYNVTDDDGFDCTEVTSIQKFRVGEKVRVWFDHKYNTAKVGKLCQKCLKPKKDDKETAEHEFCHQKHY